MLLCYVIDSGLSTSLLLLATLIIMFYIYITLHLQSDIFNVIKIASTNNCEEIVIVARTKKSNVQSVQRRPSSTSSTSLKNLAQHRWLDPVAIKSTRKLGHEIDTEYLLKLENFLVPTDKTLKKPQVCRIRSYEAFALLPIAK